jgi:hypothetical protein
MEVIGCYSSFVVWKFHYGNSNAEFDTQSCLTWKEWLSTVHVLTPWKTAEGESSQLEHMEMFVTVVNFWNTLEKVYGTAL